MGSRFNEPPNASARWMTPDSTFMESARFRSFRAMWIGYKPTITDWQIDLQWESEFVKFSFQCPACGTRNDRRWHPLEMDRNAQCTECMHKLPRKEALLNPGYGVPFRVGRFRE